MSVSAQPYRAWLYWLTVAGAAFTWPLIMVGGAVTIYRVGMAVPDWPTTFQTNMFLYDMFEAPWGVFAEHSHRLYGAAVGVVCLILAGVVSFDRLGPKGLALFLAVGLAAAVGVAGPGAGLVFTRPALMALFGACLMSAALAAYFGLVKRDPPLGLAWLVLASVVGQGVLGGYRVTQNSTFLAFLHGCTAQLFFALMAVMVVIHGRRWIQAPAPLVDTLRIRRRSLVTLIMVVVQIIVGAYVRHYGSVVAVGVHALLALAVAGHVLPLSIRLSGAPTEAAPVAASARWMVVWTTVQMVLGVLAYLLLQPFDGVAREVTPPQALIRVLHQGVGALLLASGVALAMHGRRRFSRFSPSEPVKEPASPRVGEVVA